MHSRHFPLFPFLTLVLVTACRDTFISVSSDGVIEVRVSTTGAGVDADGFSISVDGGAAQVVAAGGAVTLTNLQEGAHSVLLSGLADNCQVDGTNPRAVVVGADGRASVAFTVVCGLATTGGFTVLVSSSGRPVDPDGYLLSVAGAPSRPVAVTASETFLGLSPGIHLVALKDVVTGCELQGGNPQPFTVVAGKTIEIRLAVQCGAGG